MTVIASGTSFSSINGEARASKMEDTDPRGVRNGIGAAYGVKLLQQLRDVILGRMRRNPEPAANQLVRRALGEERQHFQFARGERDVGFRLARRRKRVDNKRVRVIVLANELESVDFGQKQRDPVGERGIGDVDCQP
jgi:hypothetical protein